jgi:LPXTG-motif cell wall-anchored protein
LLEGVGPRPIKTYKVVMSNSQWQKTQWMLLAGFPGGVLTFGGLVWLRRRK